jgi:pimeloyl-ACP methyl ester carboxylesterase
VLVPALILALFAGACGDSPTDPVGLDSVVESGIAEPVAPPGPPAAAEARALPIPPALQGCQPAVWRDEQLYQICWPESWNGSFLVYGHGYTFAGLPLAIPEEAEELAAFANGQGFAFASTSYRTNGLAIQEASEDVASLAAYVRARAAELFGSGGFVPVLVAGASEGGAAVTLAAERRPDVFQGALSTCGPTGDFAAQLRYFGDFNVLFNYFFPQVFRDPLDPDRFKVTPAGVDADVLGAWESYQARAVAALQGDPARTAELLKVAGVAVDPGDPTSGVASALGILWYNAFATNDAIEKLGGQPFRNVWTWYRGSSNDFRLNRRVERYSGDAAARWRVDRDYQTSGELDIPYVSLHTTADPIVRFWQQPRYRLKALVQGSSYEHSAVPVLRYGHCAFEEGDLTLGLALLLWKVGKASPAALSTALPTAAARSTFRDYVESQGTRLDDAREAGEGR